MKNKEQIAKIWDVLDSLNVDVLHNKQAIIKLENEREQPKLKVLDQSVFDHKYVTRHFHYAAINTNGQSIFFSDKPKCNLELGIWYSTAGSTMPMLKGYDTTDWQNSLIERKELTGSDLCRAMLERGDRCVPCDAYDGEEDWKRNTGLGLIVAAEAGCFICASGNDWMNAIPINPRTGEPLTQSDVGL